MNPKSLGSLVALRPDQPNSCCGPARFQNQPTSQGPHYIILSELSSQGNRPQDKKNMGSTRDGQRRQPSVCVVLHVQSFRLSEAAAVRMVWRRPRRWVPLRLKMRNKGPDEMMAAPRGQPVASTATSTAKLRVHILQYRGRGVDGNLSSWTRY